MYKILEKKVLGPQITKMVIDAPAIARKAEPGQFIILRIDEQGERIPLTVADFDREQGTVTIIFQIVGKTTTQLNELQAGDALLDFVGPLGKASEFEPGIRKVAVIGGGLTGSEIAYELALQGKNPVIVEMKDDLISQKGVCLANSSYLREWFELHEVPVYLETTLKEVKDGAIVCTGKDGKDIEIKCDSVISCAGYIPAPVAEKGGKRHLVGDCDKVGNLRTVVWNAYETAMKI